MARIGNPGAEEGRLEETRVVLAHDLGGGYSDKVGRPLMLAPDAERLAEAEQNERPRQKRGENAEEKQRGLPALSGRERAKIEPRRHAPARCASRHNGSTPACHKTGTAV
jgi:hypothetical protein